MVTYILLIKDLLALEDAVATLESNLPDMRMPWKVLCLTDNENDYPTIRNKIVDVVGNILQNKGESLIEYVKVLDYSRAIPLIENLPSNSYVFLWQEGRLQGGAVKRMVNEYLERPYLGFIGYKTTGFMVKDLYSDEIELVESDDDNIVTTTPTSIMLKVATFRELGDIWAKNDCSFGVELKKKGYINTIIKEVK